MSSGSMKREIVTIVEETSKAFDAWEDTCGYWSYITISLRSLLILLRRIEIEVNSPNLIFAHLHHDQEQLKSAIVGSRDTVRDLYDIVTNVRNLSFWRAKNWKRLRSSNRDIENRNSMLRHHIVAISTYRDRARLAALRRTTTNVNAIPEQIRSTVDALAAEVRAGCREGTILTAYSDDNTDVWQQFRRELISDGMKSSFIDRYKPEIQGYLKELQRRGELEEQAPQVEDSVRKARQIIRAFFSKHLHSLRMNLLSSRTITGS